jgi:hypothetical protein
MEIISGNLNKKTFRHGEVRDSDGKVFYSYLRVCLGKIAKVFTLTISDPFHRLILQIQNSKRLLATGQIYSP